MQSIWRISLLVGLVTLTAAVLPGRGVAQGQKDDNIKSVSFLSYDGVNLSGTLYKNPKGKRDAVVMLLHNFDKNGGNSTKGELPEFAMQLYKDGYSVLTFDFRGYGESTEVKPATFWKVEYNTVLLKGKDIKGLKGPETIDYKTFGGGNANYYLQLVHDIAAAKAFLDRCSDKGEVNSHNTILVGAENGATLGAIWVANETMRFKDKRGKNAFGAATIKDLADEPESKDIAACVWLSMKPKIPGRDQLPIIYTLLTDAQRVQKIPMGFYYGDKDETSSNFATAIAKRIQATSPKDKFPVSAKPIEGVSQTGSKLLDKPTRSSILKTLDSVLESRGVRENKPHESESSAFWYVTSSLIVKVPRPPKLNKRNTDEVGPVDLFHLRVTTK